MERDHALRTLLSEFKNRQVRRKSFVLESLLFVAAYVFLVLLLPPEAPVRILVESLALQTSALAAALLILLSLPNIPETSRSAWRLMAMALIVVVSLAAFASPQLFAVLALLAGLSVWLVGAGVNSVVEVFTSTVWTLAYRDLMGLGLTGEDAEPTV